MINRNPVFFMLSTVKIFEIFPKHNAYYLISEFFFCLELILFTALTNKNCCFHYNADFRQFFYDCVKLITTKNSAVIVVSSNPCVRPSARAKICLV